MMYDMYTRDGNGLTVNTRVCIGNVHRPIRLSVVTDARVGRRDSSYSGHHFVRFFASPTISSISERARGRAAAYADQYNIVNTSR